jgi:hypothetical protein
VILQITCQATDATHVKTHRIAANGVKKTPATGGRSG